MSCETYLDRIKKIKNEKKMTNERLSELTGIPLGTLSKLLAGINDSPKLGNIVAIAEVLECSLDYLMTGVPENTHNYTLDAQEMALVEAYRMLDDYGKTLLVMVTEQERDRATRQAAERALLIRDMTPAEDQPRTRGRRRQGSYTTPEQVARAVERSESYRYHSTATVAQATPTAPTVPTTPIAEEPVVASGKGGVILGGVKERSMRRDIPLYDLPVSAGVGEFLSESSRTTISIPASEKTAHATYALCISGNSMEPRYRSGDVLLVERCNAVNVGELGIFVLDGSGYFKEYGGDHLVSLNTAYDPIWLKDYDRVECCGRVVGKLKRK